MRNETWIVCVWQESTNARKNFFYNKWKSLWTRLCCGSLTQSIRVDHPQSGSAITFKQKKRVIHTQSVNSSANQKVKSEVQSIFVVGVMTLVVCFWMVEFTKEIRFYIREELRFYLFVCLYSAYVKCILWCDFGFCIFLLHNFFLVLTIYFECACVCVCVSFSTTLLLPTAISSFSSSYF